MMNYLLTPRATSATWTDGLVRHTSPESATLLVLPDPLASTVVVRVTLPHAGSAADIEVAPGAAAFVAAGVMRGTEQQSRNSLAERMDALGVSVTLSAQRETAELVAQALPEDLDELLDLVRDILRRPAFRDEDLEVVRREMLTLLQVRAADGRRVAEETLNRLLYSPTDPYSLPVKGTPESIQALRRDDLVRFWTDHYGAEGAIVAVVGPFEPIPVLDRLASWLEVWSTGRRHLPSHPDRVPPSLPGSEFITMEGKVQTEIALGMPGPGFASPDFHGALLGNLILGEIGLMGRVGDSLRTRRGIAYHAGSTLSGERGGPWFVSAALRPALARTGVEMILEEIHRLSDEGPSPEELEGAATNRWGWAQVRAATSRGKAELIAYAELYQDGPDYWERFPAAMGSVTTAEVVAALRRYFPGPYGLAAAGPPSTIL